VSKMLAVRHDIESKALQTPCSLHGAHMYMVYSYFYMLISTLELQGTHIM